MPATSGTRYRILARRPVNLSDYAKVCRITGLHLMTRYLKAYALHIARAIQPSVRIAYDRKYEMTKL